jgi:hypothetical protein
VSASGNASACALFGVDDSGVSAADWESEGERSAAIDCGEGILAVLGPTGTSVAVVAVVVLLCLPWAMDV